MLIKISRLASTLEDSWDNHSYEVLKCLSDVNYEVCIPRYRGKRILHLNNYAMGRTSRNGVEDYSCGRIPSGSMVRWQQIKEQFEVRVSLCKPLVLT